MRDLKKRDTGGTVPVIHFDEIVNRIHHGVHIRVRHRCTVSALLICRSQVRVHKGTHLRVTGEVLVVRHAVGDGARTTGPLIEVVGNVEVSVVQPTVLEVYQRYVPVTFTDHHVARKEVIVTEHSLVHRTNTSEV